MLEEAGFYNFENSSSSVSFNGIKFDYFSSGLLREVYISPCKKYVLKVPITEDLYDFEKEDIKRYLNGGADYYAHLSIRHNICEAMVYEECPKEYKHMFAVTELLDNGWLKQEYVDVKSTYDANCKEIGIKDGQYKFFDCDFFFKDYKKPVGGFNYERGLKFLKSLNI